MASNRGSVLNRLMDIVEDNPFVGVIALMFTAYMVVEIVAIIFLHHTVDF